jgi:hypothetical protein
MGRPRKPESEKLVRAALAIAPEIDAELDAILENDGHTKGQLARMIFMRGWAAYKRDGKLVEPKDAADRAPVMPYVDTGNHVSASSNQSINPSDAATMPPPGQVEAERGTDPPARKSSSKKNIK